MNKATAAQNQLATEQADFYKTYGADFSTRFANQSGVLSLLQQAWQPVLAGGPNQPGFSGQEAAALNSQAINQTAQTYAQAAKAAGEAEAAKGGGNTFLPSGARSQIDAQIRTSAAQQESNLENQITQQNYATGRQNFLNATNALSGVAGQFDPLGYATATTNAGNSAFNMDTQIQQENSAWQGELGGLIGGAAGAALGNPSLFK